MNDEEGKSAEDMLREEDVNLIEELQKLKQDADKMGQIIDTINSARESREDTQVKRNVFTTQDALDILAVTSEIIQQQSEVREYLRSDVPRSSERQDELQEGILKVQLEILKTHDSIMSLVNKKN